MVGEMGGSQRGPEEECTPQASRGQEGLSESKEGLECRRELEGLEVELSRNCQLGEAASRQRRAVRFP